MPTQAQEKAMPTNILDVLFQETGTLLPENSKT